MVMPGCLQMPAYKRCHCCAAKAICDSTAAICPCLQVFELADGVASRRMWQEVTLLRDCVHERLVPLYGVAMSVRNQLAVRHASQCRGLLGTFAMSGSCLPKLRSP